MENRSILVCMIEPSLPLPPFFCRKIVFGILGIHLILDTSILSITTDKCQQLQNIPKYRMVPCRFVHDTSQDNPEFGVQFPLWLLRWAHTWGNLTVTSSPSQGGTFWHRVSSTTSKSCPSSCLHWGFGFPVNVALYCFPFSPVTTFLQPGREKKKNRKSEPTS